MKTLRFIVDNQTISLDPNCDTSTLVPGSSGYLSAEFAFSHDWDGCLRVAAFFSPLGREYPPRELAYGKSCVVPFEALQKRSFKVQVIGMKFENGKAVKFKTNKVVVHQNGGKK